MCSVLFAPGLSFLAQCYINSKTFVSTRIPSMLSHLPVIMRLYSKSTAPSANATQRFRTGTAIKTPVCVRCLADSVNVFKCRVMELRENVQRKTVYCNNRTVSASQCSSFSVLN